MAKDFTAPNNPAMAFISTADAEEKPKTKTAGGKSKTNKGKTHRRGSDAENRTRRVQAVLTPTLYDQLSDTAWKNRQSVNETIVKAIEEYIRRQK